MPYASRNGVRLYYEREGSGDPPFVFVHGWCCDHTFFGPQFEHYRVAHEVVTFDLRGCGKSDVPESGYDIPTLADDVASLCGELEVERPIVVGHSLGGMIGIDLAARHPSVPRAIVAVDPGPIDPLPESRELFEALLAKLEAPDGHAERRSYVAGMFLDTDDADRKQAIVDTMCAAPLGPAAAVIRGVLEWEGAAALAACEAPLLVVRSGTVGSNVPERLLPLKPDLYFGITVGAGHFHQLEVPEQIVPMIDRFLRVAVADRRDILAR